MAESLSAVMFFAVRRAQYHLRLVPRLRETGRIQEIPVFLDSTRAITAAKIYCTHKEDHKLTDDHCYAIVTHERSLVDGTDEIKIHSQYISARTRVVQIHGLSAHADLTDWLRASHVAPKRVFVTHEEPSASDAFRRRLPDAFPGTLLYRTTDRVGKSNDFLKPRMERNSTHERTASRNSNGSLGLSRRGVSWYRRRASRQNSGGVPGPASRVSRSPRS